MGEEWIIGVVFVGVGILYFVLRGVVTRLGDED